MYGKVCTICSVGCTRISVIWSTFVYYPNNFLNMAYWNGHMEGCRGINYRIVSDEERNNPIAAKELLREFKWEYSGKYKFSYFFPNTLHHWINSFDRFSRCQVPLSYKIEVIRYFSGISYLWVWLFERMCFLKSVCFLIGITHYIYYHRMFGFRLGYCWTPFCEQLALSIDNLPLNSW